MVPDLTAAAGAPRVAAIEFPFGRPLGQPGDADTQRAVLRATLAALTTAPASRAITHLPFVWPETHDQVHWHPKESSPISRLLASALSMLKRLVSGEIPAAASRREPDQQGF
jgi:hypothetical protein